MQTIRLISVLVVGMLATCSAAYSQGSGGGGGGGGSTGGGGSSPTSSGSAGSAPVAGGARSPIGNRGDGAFGDFSSFQTTGTMKGRITWISLAEHRVTVEDGKGKVKTFKLAFDAKMKADKKTDLGQKKDLALEDFQTGQPVKVVYRDSDETAVEVKLLPR